MISRPYFIFVFFLFNVIVLGGCVTTAPDRIAINALSLNDQNILKESKRVLVINSNQSIERYQIAESTFVAALNEYSTRVINLEDERQPVEFLQDILNANSYDLIYCIGTKALGSIDYIDPDLPVVYTAVLNWRKFQNRKNYFGISSELSPQVQLTWFKYFFPDMKNIGVFYSEKNESLINDAQAVSKNLSLKLKAVKITNDDELLTSAKTFLSEIDALWLISDSITISSVKSVDALFNLAEKQRLPVITYNPVFVDMGAMMSLVADLPTTARQAALLAMKILEKDLPLQAVQFPAGSRIILNGEKLKRYKVKLSPDVLDSVDELR